MAQTSTKAKKNGPGFPVLAYPTSDATSPLSLRLIFRSKAKEGKATLCLRYSQDDVTSFILQYDPDHLISSNSLGPATIPQSQLAIIGRTGNADIRKLSLRLRECCTFWYPRLVSMPPEPGLDIPFNRLVNLAAATELEIVFDYCYVGDEQQVIFKRLIDQPESLCGFPVGRTYERLFTPIDVSDCRIIDDVDADSTTDEEQAPPSYDEASVKRGRSVSTSPTPCPPSKRVYTGSALALRENIFSAVERQLPAIVEGMLPNYLIGRLSTPSPVLSPFHSDCGDPTSQPPPSPKLSFLGERLAASITKQVKQELQSIYTRAVSHAEWLCNNANDDILGELEDRKLDIAMIKDDVESEIGRTATYKLEELREQAEEVCDNELSQMEQIVNDVCDNVKERLNKLAQNERTWIQRERGWLRWQNETLKRDIERFEDEKRALEPSTTNGRGARAQSASL